MLRQHHKEVKGIDFGTVSVFLKLWRLPLPKLYNLIIDVVSHQLYKQVNGVDFSTSSVYHCLDEEWHGDDPEEIGRHRQQQSESIVTSGLIGRAEAREMIMLKKKTMYMSADAKSCACLRISRKPIFGKFNWPPSVN